MLEITELQGRKRNFIVLLSPPPALQFTNQFAFRPAGSTTAAIISLLHSVINFLSSNPYVIVISLDFPKAFDTVRHSTLLSKLAQLDLPDHVYHWLADFFTGHSHCTSFCGQTSDFESINASIIQGSAIWTRRICCQCWRPQNYNFRQLPP